MRTRLSFFLRGFRLVIFTGLGTRLSQPLFSFLTPAVRFFAISTRSLKPRNPASSFEPAPRFSRRCRSTSTWSEVSVASFHGQSRIRSRSICTKATMPISLRSGRTGTRPPTSYRDANISPTLSATTSASKLDLGEEGPKIIVTRADVRLQACVDPPAEEGNLPAARALPTCSSANPSPRMNSFSPLRKDTGTPSSRSLRRRRLWQARSANAHESRAQATAERT